MLLVAPLISNAFGAGAAAATPANTSISLQFGRPGTAANSMTIAASGMRPGDVVERTLDIVLSTKAPARVSLTTRIAKSSLLDRRPDDGIQLTIVACDASWIEGPSGHFACWGHMRTLVPTTPLSRAKRGAPTVLSPSTGSTTFHLRVQLMLPSRAGNALQGQASVLRFDVSALPARAH